MAASSWIPGSVIGVPPDLCVHNRLLGFVRTVILRQLVEPGSVVCDLFCGRGLDTEKWSEAEIGRYIGVDLSASALEEAREQWEQKEKPFPANFCELDPCMADLQDKLQDYGLPADVVCCFSHLQDCFTNEDMVRRFLKNIATVLRSGGYFLGTAPDSSTIWYKYQKAVEDAMRAGSLRVNGTLPCVRADLYKISFDDDRFHAFGSKFFLRFVDDGLPAQPQILVHFPSLIRLAKEFDLECVEVRNLQEFYEDSYGPFADVLQGSCGSLVDSKGVPVLDSKGKLNAQSLDVLSLYTTIILKKSDPGPQYLRTALRTEDVPKSSLAETRLSVYTRRKEERTDGNTARRTDPLKLDEEPTADGHQGTNNSEDPNEFGAGAVMWPKDVHESSDGMPEAGVGQKSQANHDHSDSSSVYRPHGSKLLMTGKYYTRSTGLRDHHGNQMANCHHGVNVVHYAI